MEKVLLEIFTEEIPALLQPYSRERIKLLMQQKLNQLGFNNFSINVYSSPNRLTVYILNIESHLPSKTNRIKGPSTNVSEEIFKKFLESNNIQAKNCFKESSPKGEFWFFEKFEPAIKLKKLFPKIVLQIIRDFKWPKSMLWGNNNIGWIRPIRGGLALLGNDPIRFIIDLNKNEVITDEKALDSYKKLSNNLIMFDNKMNFKNENAIVTRNFDDYKTILKENDIIFDNDERKSMIKTDIKNKVLNFAKKKDLELKATIDEKLLDEVTGIITYPQAIIIEIEAKLMDIPQDIIRSSAEKHQKYFTIKSKDKLSPYFVVVCDGRKEDITKQTKGFAAILKARLADGKFFYENDLERPLNDYNLANMNFYDGLGNMADKVIRLKKLSRYLSQLFDKDNKELISDSETAAEYCKHDLFSATVGEFPNLQGLLGSYCLKHNGFNDNIVDALATYYQPLGPNDDIPKKPVSCILAIADKIDNIVGMHIKNIKATGSGDKFGLRRSAFGIIRILNQCAIPVSIESLVKKSYEIYDIDSELSLVEVHDLSKKLFLERIAYSLKQGGIEHKIIEALKSHFYNDELYYVIEVAHKLDELKKTLSFKEILSAYKRAFNLIKGYSPFPKPPCFENKIEQELYKSLNQNVSEFDKNIEIIAENSKKINKFIDENEIHRSDEKIKQERLFLLQHFCSIVNKIANFDELI